MEQKLVANILEKYHPRAIILHGSRVTGGATEKSDWDFVLLVDETKNPKRGFVDGENVEFDQVKLPIDPKDAFEKFGLKFRKGGVKIIYDPENIAQPLVSACQTEIEKGFRIKENNKEGYKAFMEGLLSKIERYENEKIAKLDFIGQFISRAINTWFPIKEEKYSIPPYESIPYIKEKDPKFYSLLNEFADSSGEEQIKKGEEIISYLLS